MHLSAVLTSKFHLKPAERLMMTVALGALAVDAVLVIYKGASLDYAGYGGILAVVAALFSGGVFYRMSERDENIASALICASTFIFFSACLSLFNYLLLPLTRATIDIPLTQIDAMLGFHWPDVMAYAAHFPNVMFVTKLAYLSTIPQFALLVVVLGLTARHRELQILITSVTITATFTICFWGLFPTLGAKTMYAIPDAVWAAVNPPVNKAYALDLLNLAAHGPAIISPSEIRGLIAFPSYHAVLAFTAIYAARNVKFLGPVFWIINLMILPSIFMHGGHHLVDLPAGFAVFLAGTLLATRLVNQTVNAGHKPAYVSG